MDKKVAIHVAKNLRNQVVYGDYLLSGFKSIGFKPFVTHSPSADADMHVCIGPHFALSENISKKTIYVDRCLWGDDMEFVTLGFIDDFGGMVYPKDAPNDRYKPEIKEWKTSENNPIYLRDYNGPLISGLDIRHHPTQSSSSESLLQCLRKHDYAIGFRTSALVTAAIEGLPIICLDSRCPAYEITGYFGSLHRPPRDQWLNNMSYAQWAGSEINSGEALDYVINRTNC